MNNSNGQNGSNGAGGPQWAPLPNEVPIDGQMSIRLKEYILGNPCPNFPVSVAVELIGGLEMAMRMAAKAAIEPKTSPAGVITDEAAIKAEASRLARERGDG